MAVSHRAVRLKAAAQYIEQAPTIEEKVQGLRALVSMPKLGRRYIKFVREQLLKCRLSVADMPNQEGRLGQLDLIDKKLKFALECEAQRKAARQGKKPPVSPAAPASLAPGVSQDPAEGDDARTTFLKSIGRYTGDQDAHNKG